MIRTLVRVLLRVFARRGRSTPAAAHPFPPLAVSETFYGETVRAVCARNNAIHRARQVVDATAIVYLGFPLYSDERWTARVLLDRAYAQHEALSVAPVHLAPVAP